MADNEQNQSEYSPDQWNINQTVEIITGPFVGLTGIIYFIDEQRKRVRVTVSLFGRATPAELSFTQIKPCFGQ